MHPHQALIEQAFEQRSQRSTQDLLPELRSALEEVIQSLDEGSLRVAEKIEGAWKVHEWIKKAILLTFKLNESVLIDGACTQYFDKVPLKYANYTRSDFQAQQVRVVPSALVRRGAYIAPQTILMPSYVNVGAYVDTGCMIDTWATVGSCAQIGKNVHLSGGAGIGGVLEPLQAQPTIIEDDCFIGARSEIVEGVIVEQGSVIAMGVFLGQSTKIYHRLTGEITYGRIPAGSVVVPGSLPSADGSHQLAAAIIIKQVDAQTRKKVSLNELLRDEH
jgi:2,3,4,5-tetrahydropyridine-2-carboxylate N-succinyltransferase